MQLIREDLEAHFNRWPFPCNGQKSGTEFECTNNEGRLYIFYPFSNRRTALLPQEVAARGLTMRGFIYHFASFWPQRPLKPGGFHGKLQVYFRALVIA